MATLEEYKKKRDQLLQMGGPKAIESQHKEGKLTARERLEYFFDPGTFVELGLYVRHRQTAFGMDKKNLPAEGVLVGYGRVGQTMDKFGHKQDRMVVVAAEDYTTMAGTFGEYHGKKFSQAVDFAKDKGWPFVGMNDSGGARLQEGVDSLECYGWLFTSQILASGIVPQIALLMGPCLGGQAYHPIMQDFLIQCKNTGFMGIAGPAFVKEQTGEEIDLVTLCGWRAQMTKAGQSHFIAEDDKDCLDKAKALLSFFPNNNKEKPPYVSTSDAPDRADDSLNTLVPDQPFVAFDMREVIKRIVDDGYFVESLKEYGRSVITGFARFNGRSVGLVANQPSYAAGSIDTNAADKVARFVRFCDLFNIPLLNLHDAPGYMIGSDQEWKGILRHGAKMLYAYIEATVPKITVIVRKSFAGAYFGMCSKDSGADLVFAWPNASISIVGAETAASVIFAKEIKTSENPKETRTQRIKEFRDLYENPYRAAERGYVDDVIMPSDTRKYINRALDILENKTVSRPWRKYSNINL